MKKVIGYSILALIGIGVFVGGCVLYKSLSLVTIAFLVALAIIALVVLAMELIEG